MGIISTLFYDEVIKVDLKHPGIPGVLRHSVYGLLPQDASLRERVEKNWHNDVAYTMYNRSMTIC
jgi:hypothetical protein